MKYLMVTAVILLCAACDDDPSGTQVISDVSWFGSHDAGTVITFNVSNNTIEDLESSVDFDLEAAPDTVFSWKFDADITDYEFHYVEVSSAGNWEFGLDMSGTFDSSNHVAGDLIVSVVYADQGVTETDTIETTWNAMTL